MNIDFTNLIAKKDVPNISEFSCQNFLDEYRFGGEDELTNLSKAINIEKSILTVYSNWFRIANKFYYFKNKFCFEEILMGEIFRKFGVKSVEHQIVQNDGIYGIISENFRKPDYKYIRFDKFIEIDMPINLKMFKSIIENKVNAYDINKINETISKIIALDIMFGQNDREYHNVFFEQTAKNITVAPMFDNGLIFCRYYGGIMYSSCFDNIEMFDEYINNYTIKVFEENPQIVKYLNQALSINMNELLTEIQEKYYLIVSKKTSKEIMNYYDDNRKITEKTLKLIR